MTSSSKKYPSGNLQLQQQELQINAKAVTGFICKFGELQVKLQEKLLRKHSRLSCHDLVPVKHNFCLHLDSTCCILVKTRITEVKPVIIYNSKYWGHYKSLDIHGTYFCPNPEKHDSSWSRPKPQCNILPMCQASAF